MNDPFSPSPNGWSSAFGQDAFPGIAGSGSGPVSVSGPPAVTVVEPAAITAQPVSANPVKSALPFNLSNLGELKNLVERMGGIEGILSTMGKVQKFMSTMQQMAPMIKLFLNKGAKASTANHPKPAPRRRSTRRRSVRKPSSRRVSKKR